VSTALVCHDGRVPADDRGTGAIGQRIRDLRVSRGITLTALAEASHLSTGLISQVERGLSDPSLETLRKVSSVLDVPLFSLFQDDSDEQVAVVRCGQRMLVQSPNHDITYSRISAGSGQLEVLQGRLKPHSASSEQPWAHPSEECLVVLDGVLIVEVSDEDYELRAGDSCYFDSNRPHRYRNDFDEPVEFIISVTPPSY
jgi:transcriptional regulator with XRE-family HTH domain